MIRLRKCHDVSKFCEEALGRPETDCVAVSGKFVVATSDCQLVAVEHDGDHVNETLAFNKGLWTNACESAGVVDDGILTVSGTDYEAAKPIEKGYPDWTRALRLAGDPLVQIGVSPDELAKAMRHCRREVVVLTVFSDRVEWHCKALQTWGVLMAIVEPGTQDDEQVPLTAPLLRDRVGVASK